MKFRRKKGRNVLLSFFYKVDKIIPFSKKRKLKLYLDLAWVFERFAHELSFKVFGKENHPLRSKSASFLIRHLDRSQEILDLGCNSGDLTFLLSKHVRSTTGIDFDKKLIDQAKRKYAASGITFVAHEVTSFLQNNVKRFDVLVLSHILEHLDDPGSFLRFCNDHFKYIYIEVPDVERTPLNVYRELMGAKLRYSDADHIWEFDRKTLQQLIIASGLKIEDMEFIWGSQKYWVRSGKNNVPQNSKSPSLQ